MAGPFPRPGVALAAALALALAWVHGAAALNNGAALTPPMGWSTWNKLRCKYDAARLLEEADNMVAQGLVQAGYKTLNIDDCWPLKARDASGLIVPDPAKFPYGMRNFSAELAKRGLGLGIYTAHGNFTCQHFPGSFGHEDQDAKAYSDWGVVFVKNDWCWHNEPDQSKHLSAFNALRDSLGKQPGNITYSVHWNYGDTAGPGCPKGEDCPLPLTANMWRVGNDIKPAFDSILRLIDTTAGHGDKAGPSAWNDMDMLEVGNGMSATEDAAHFSMWAILASPLIAGNDLGAMSPATKAILTNKWVIQVGQDPLGLQAKLVLNTTEGTSQVWAKKLAPGSAYAVALLNRGSSPASITATFSAFSSASRFEVLDLWASGKSLGVHTGSVTASSVPAHGVAMYRLVPPPTA